MSAERRGPAICKVSNIGEGKDEMIKASDDLQDLRRRIYVKAKAEPSWRFWVYTYVCSGARASAGNDGVRQSRKSPQQDRSHKPRHEANGGAQCGKSARCVRRGGGWKRGRVETLCPKPARQSSTLPVSGSG